MNTEDNSIICEIEDESRFIIDAIINEPVKKHDQRIKTHHKYCFCNTKNLLYFCPVKNHKTDNPHINKNVIYLIKSEIFSLEIKEYIIKKLNRNIYFEEHHKVLERRKELDEIGRSTGNEFYDEFYYYKSMII